MWIFFLLKKIKSKGGFSIFKVKENSQGQRKRTTKFIYHLTTGNRGRLESGALGSQVQAFVACANSRWL